VCVSRWAVTGNCRNTQQHRCRPVVPVVLTGRLYVETDVNSNHAQCCWQGCADIRVGHGENKVQQRTSSPTALGLWHLYDPETKQEYIQLVTARNAATLLPIIQRVVEPGSTIWSDKWQAYWPVRCLGFLTASTSVARQPEPAPTTWRRTGEQSNAVSRTWSVQPMTWSHPIWMNVCGGTAMDRHPGRLCWAWLLLLVKTLCHSTHGLQ